MNRDYFQQTQPTSFQLPICICLPFLNSRITFYYLKHLCAVLGEADQRGRLRFFSQYMEELPIRRINFTTPAVDRDRQLEKAKTLYQRCLDRGSTDCVLGFVKHHLTADPERSDAVHDLLAFLAEQMVGLNKAKGKEIRGFLRWLERRIRGQKLIRLEGKTKIQRYFDLSFEELLEILNQKPSIHRPQSIRPTFPRITGARV